METRHIVPPSLACFLSGRAVHHVLLALALLTVVDATRADQPHPGDGDAFIAALKTHLGDRVLPCTGSQWLGLERDRYYMEAYGRRRKAAPPRDVTCFDYDGKFREFKKQWKEFFKLHAETYGIATRGRWHYDEWLAVPKTYVGGSDLQRAKTYGSRWGFRRLELEADGIRGALVFDDAHNCVSVWIERRKQPPQSG